MERTANQTSLSQMFNLSNGRLPSDNYSNSSQQYIYAGQLLQQICIPIICAVGLCGNTLSFVVFLSGHMRRSSCSVGLAALAFVDNLFLLSLMITWIDGNWADILTSMLPCLCIIFITYVSSFLSVWFIVGFTCERFFVICYPFRAHTCTNFRRKTAVLSLTLLACVSYSFCFWTVTVRQIRSRPMCVFRNQYFDFLHAAAWVDTVITFVIPFLTITTVNAKVLQTIIRRSKQTQMSDATFRRLSTDPSQRCTKSLPPVRKRRSGFRGTKTLLLVSTTFLVLNLPSHLVRLYNLIACTLTGGNDHTTSLRFRFMQELGNMLFYTTFGCNFILYALFGRKFRHSLKSMFMCRSYVEVERRRVLKQLQRAGWRDSTGSTNLLSKHGSVNEHHTATRNCQGCAV